MAKKLKGPRFQLSIGIPQRGLVTRDFAGKTTENGELHIADCEGSVLTNMTTTNFANLFATFSCVSVDIKERELLGLEFDKPDS